MDKPVQTRILEAHPDNGTLLDELENALFNIAEAMERLRGYEVTEDWFNTLDDMFDEIKPVYDECEAIAVAEYAEEMDGLRRQYYRSVL